MGRMTPVDNDTMKRLSLGYFYDIYDKYNLYSVIEDGKIVAVVKEDPEDK